MKLRIFDDMNPFMVKRFEVALTKPFDVEVFINATGGSLSILHELLACRKQMRLRGQRVRGIVIDYAVSASFNFLQSCDERWSMSWSRFMFHPPQIYPEEVLGDHVRWRETPLRSCQYDWGYGAFLTQLAVRTKIPLPTLYEWGMAQRVFTAQEALELGFIDRILIHEGEEAES